MSVGIERVFAILKAKHLDAETRGSETQVYVMGLGNVSVEDRLAIVKELWDAGIKVVSFLAANDRRNSHTRLNQGILGSSSNTLREWQRQSAL
jgi:histidyl-tRNA synthetase